MVSDSLHFFGYVFGPDSCRSLVKSNEPVHGEPNFLDTTNM